MSLRWAVGELRKTKRASLTAERSSQQWNSAWRVEKALERQVPAKMPWRGW